ncbi:MAG: tyrosine-type recombinase/integrase [Anaerolineae bacterium]
MQPDSFNDPAEDAPGLFDLIDHFCLHLKLSAGASPSAANTARSYATAMSVFKKFVKHSYSRKHGVKAPYPAAILNHDVLLAYYDWLAKTSPGKTGQARRPLPEPDAPSAGPPDAAPSPPPPPPRYAHATIQHYLAAAKRFLTWAVAQNYLSRFDLGKANVKLSDGRGKRGGAYPHRKIDPNLAAIILYYDNLPLPGEDAPPQPAGQSNLAKWQVRRQKIAILRNRAIVRVLFDTGLRVSELTGLTRDEIDRALKTTPLPEDVALEVVGKGGRRRTVWITQESLRRIEAYLAARNDSSNVLFVGSKKGTPITRQMVWKIVKEGAKAAGVGDFTGPHAFRHWLARQLFNDEDDPVPIEDVQALLGHASPNTTRTIYAPHTSQARLHKALKKARKRPEDTINNTEMGT